MFEFSQKSKDRRKGVDQRLIQISDLALEISNIDFGIPGDGGFRSPKRQKELFDLGKSKCDGTIRKSKHQSGKALDFYAYVNGKASWEKEHLAIVAAAHLQAASQLGYKLEWGGNWNSWQDFPHIQLSE